MNGIAKISVVIPAYNENNNIKITFEEIFSVLNKLPEIEKVEVIVVDDHSSDGIFVTIREMNDPRVKCLRLSRRCGSHTALRAGLRESTGNVVLCISADGQDDPGCLSDMLKKWNEGAHIVWALRKSRKNEPWYIQKFAQIFYKVLVWLGGAGKGNIDVSRANFFILDRKVVDTINKCMERNTSLFGLIIWLGFKQDFVEYERRQRRLGKSKWNFSSNLYLAKDWIVAFSGLPLKLATLIGSLIAICGMIYAIYVIYRALFISPALGLRSIPAWASTICFILILGGLQILILGVIGEYLWRNLDESRRRPLYFIEDSFEVE